MEEIKEMVHKEVGQFERVTLNYIEEKMFYLIAQGYEDDEAAHLKCESEIERLLFLALSDFFKNASHFNDRFEYLISPQKEVVYRNHRYRTDIFLSVADLVKEKHIDFVIECDGHDFHEKTKEQVRKDRSRERNLMKFGYTVIRFSGSEIVEDPDECALQVWEILKVRIGL